MQNNLTCSELQLEHELNVIFNNDTAQINELRISVCPATCSGFIRPGVSV